MSWRIHQGHVLDVLPTLPDQSVHTVVTSPPYFGLRDYGLPAIVWGWDATCTHEWGEEGVMVRSGGSANTTLHLWANGQTKETAGDQIERSTMRASTGSYCQQCGAWRGQLGLEPTPALYVAHLVQVFREVYRVLRDDGTLWLNLGDSYVSAPRGNKNGWEGSGLNGVASQTYQDTLNAGTARTMDKTKIPGLKTKDLIGIPWRVAFALQEDGWYLRSDIIWNKPNPMPEPVTDRPTKSHEYIFLLTKSADYFYDHEAVKEQTVSLDPTHPSYRPNSEAIAREGRKEFSAKHESARMYAMSGRNKRSVWTITTQPYPGAHFATFPEEIPETCIKAGTSEGGVCSTCGTPWTRMVEDGEPLREQQKASGGGDGIYTGQATKAYAGTGAQDPSEVKRRILAGMVEKRTVGWQQECRCDTVLVAPAVVMDIFNGSGTTGLVADRLGRDYIGIELNPEYLALARDRVNSVTPLFSSEVPA